MILNDETSIVSFSEAVYVRAKTQIISHMLSAGQKLIAIRYLKKVIFDHNRNYRVQAMVLERAAKLILRGGENGLSIKEFT